MDRPANRSRPTHRRRAASSRPSITPSTSMEGVMGRLQDKVTIITGGASGMGRVAARMFAAEGARVVVADVTEQAAQSVVDDLKAAGAEAIAVVADVSKEP